MKEKFLIFLALIVLIIALVGLNAASFVQKEKVPDTEFSPNRSTYNTGATGTRAFYDLLAETGRRVTRWQEPPSALFSAGKNKPDTFVVVGSVRREFEDDDITKLLKWVSEGGKLVIIDRNPPEPLISTTADWNIKTASEENLAVFNSDPTDQKQMTDGTIAAKPVQPTIYTANVISVQPSRFASSIKLEHYSPDDKPFKVEGKGEGIGTKNVPVSDESAPLAPLVHLANDRKNLLVDFPYGAGKIVYLADPYIVTNGGINLVDNAQLAVNVVASGDGLIAFDEYHHGYGSNNNQLLTYFAGTPVVPIILQLMALVGLIFFSKSRRFARPLPENEPNRLSKLEYVAAMAELQQRTKAFDLAIENIYTDFRRRVARSFGVDNFTTPRADLARMIAERLPEEDFREIDQLMRSCENISQGEATNKKEVLELAGRLREIEEKLGLQRRKKRRQK
jgi:hypothetical protein